jgi:hypothetical protein
MGSLMMDDVRGERFMVNSAAEADDSCIAGKGEHPQQRMTSPRERNHRCAEFGDDQAHLDPIAACSEDLKDKEAGPEDSPQTLALAPSRH